MHTSLHHVLRRKKRKKEKPSAYLADVPDRKLRGQLKHTERLYAEANKAAARVNEWLAPAEGGFLETEGAAPHRRALLVAAADAVAACIAIAVAAAAQHGGVCTRS